MARPYPRPVVVQRPVDRVVVRFLVEAVIASGAMANLLQLLVLKENAPLGALTAAVITTKMSVLNFSSPRFLCCCSPSFPNREGQRNLSINTKISGRYFVKKEIRKSE